jgi:hypothetical protein
MGRSLFTLPPVSQRRMIGGIIQKHAYPGYTKEADDTYIYYLIMKYSFFVTTMLSLLYWGSYANHTSFNFFFFNIDVWHYNFLARVLAALFSHDKSNPGHLVHYSVVLSMICSYSVVVVTVLFVIFVPYAWALFRANIDLDAIDLAHCNKQLFGKISNNQEELPKAYKKSFYVYLIGMFGAFALPMFFLGHHLFLENSTTFFVTFLCFYAGIFSYGIAGVVMCFAVYRQLKQKRGPRFQSNPTVSE